MTFLLRAAFAASLFSLPVVAQDFLLYKFEGGCSDEVVNYAPQGAVIGNGIRLTTSALANAAGAYGDGLAGATVPSNGTYNRVRTGWNPNTNPVVGDCTLAMFVKQRVAPTSTSYFFGAAAGFRMFTGGVAGLGLWLRNGAATGADIILSTNLQSLAANEWVHVALVVNANTGVATWYLDGLATAQVTGLVGGMNTAPATSGELLIGGSGAAYSSCYDLDEVLLSRRIYTPAEIAQLATGTRAGYGSYSHGIPMQCGTGNVTFGPTGGRPHLGNANFAVEVATPMPALHLALFGFSRCSFGGVAPLPLDGGLLLPMLSGCTLLADAPILLASVSTGAPTSFAVPIPSTAPMGASLFCQALSLDPATNHAAMSMGLALGVGN